MKNLSFPTKKS